jgi:hypothetical protein
MALGYRDKGKVESETSGLLQSLPWLEDGHSEFHLFLPTPLTPLNFSSKGILLSF